MITKTFKTLTLIVLFGFLILAGTTVLAQADPGSTWQDSPSNPPNCSTDPNSPDYGGEGCNPPLNVGPSDQIKTGGLILGGDLTTKGRLMMTAGKMLETAFGLVGKETNAGKIFYNKYNTGSELVIYGGGTAPGNRRVKIFDNLNVVGDITTDNNFYAKNYYICSTPTSCTTFTGGNGVSYWTPVSGQQEIIYSGRVGIAGANDPNSSVDLAIGNNLAGIKANSTGELSLVTSGTKRLTITSNGQIQIPVSKELCLGGVCRSAWPTSNGSTPDSTSDLNWAKSDAGNIYNNNGEGNVSIGTKNSIDGYKLTTGSGIFLNGLTANGSVKLPFGTPTYYLAPSYSNNLDFGAKLYATDTEFMINGVGNIGTRNVKIRDNLEVTNALLAEKICLGSPNNCLNEWPTALTPVGNFWASSTGPSGKTNLYSINDGNVGIGTNNPIDMLTVSSPSSGAIIRLVNSTPGANGQSWRLRADNPNGSFEIRDATKQKLRLAIDVNGNVGIGDIQATQTGNNANPGLKTEISGTGGSPAAAGEVQGAGSLRLSASGSQTVLDMGVADNGFSAPGLKMGWIQATNKSALGTLYPLYLNPKGGSVIAVNLVSNKLTLSGATPTDTTNALYTVTVAPTVNPATPGSTKLYFDGKPIGDSSWTTNGDNTYYAKSGNVGIGTNDPKNKLSVAGYGTFSGGIGVFSSSIFEGTNFMKNGNAISFQAGDTTGDGRNGIIQGQKNTLIIYGNQNEAGVRSVDIKDNLNVSGKITTNSLNLTGSLCDGAGACQTITQIINAAGANGSIGPAGPQGPVGPIGPQGPAGSSLVRVYCEFGQSPGGNSLVDNGSCPLAVAVSPNGSNGDFTLKCPPSYRIVSGGGWCDNTGAGLATLPGVLRESRPESDQSWRISCSRVTSSVAGLNVGKITPGGGSIVCEK